MTTAAADMPTPAISDAVRPADRLWYFAPAHQGFPGKSANNIQMMKVCDGCAAAGQPTTLVVPRRPDTASRLQAAGDLREMYGRSADVRLEWCAFPYPFTALQQGLWAPVAAARALRRRVTFAYARHEWTAAALASVGIPVVCELHHFVPNGALRSLFRRAVRGQHVAFVGPTWRGTRDRAVSAGLSNVRFEGDVPNAKLPLYLFAADVLAMPYTQATPTHRYMSPMKLFEYLAAGRPIVASDFPVLHEVLTSGEDVLFVPPSDAEAFARAVRQVVSDSALAQKMGRSGRRTAARYTWVERQRAVLRFASSRFDASFEG